MNTIIAEAKNNELTISGMGEGFDGVYDIKEVSRPRAERYNDTERFDFIVKRNEMKSEIMANANANQTGFTFKRNEKEDWGMIEPQTEIKSEGEMLTVAECIELLRIRLVMLEGGDTCDGGSDIDKAWGNLELLLVNRMARLASMDANGER